MLDQKFNDERILRAFVDKMIIDKDPSVDNVNRLALREALGDMLNERMEKAAVGALPDDKLIEVDEMLQQGASDDAIEKIFAESGVDYAKAMEREMKAFREEYLRGEIAIDMMEALAQVSPMHAEVKSKKPANPGASIISENTQAQPEQQKQPVQAQPETVIQAQAETVVTAPSEPAAQPVAMAQSVVEQVTMPAAQAVQQPVQPVTSVPAVQPEPAAQVATQPVVPGSVVTPAGAPVMPTLGQVQPAVGQTPDQPGINPTGANPMAAPTTGAEAVNNPTIITPMTGEEH